MKQLPNISNNRKGFTLIELLVVIAIIAILATIGAAIFSGVQQRARNARREGDVTAIAKAFEAQKVAGSTSYPLISATWFGGGVIPADSYTGATPPVYSIAYVDVPNCVVGRAGSASWDSNTANPLASSFTLTPAACDTLVIGAVSAAPIGITSFQICALREGATNDVFCVANQQ